MYHAVTAAQFAVKKSLTWNIAVKGVIPLSYGLVFSLLRRLTGFSGDQQRLRKGGQYYTDLKQISSNETPVFSITHLNGAIRKVSRN